MAVTIEVETQGISDDWTRADGDFETKSRGLLEAEQVLSALLHLAPLDIPAGDDPCPPQIVTRGHAASFSFIGQGGSIFCPDTDTELTAKQACDMAFGKKAMAPPPPMPARPAKSAPKTTQKTLRKSSPVVIAKRKFGWRSWIVMILSLCFLLGAVVMVFGVFSMLKTGRSTDDIRTAMVIGGALGVIGGLLFALAFKARSSRYLDASGTRVNEDGSALTFMVMAQSLGDFDGGDDGYDGGDFDGDFD